MSKPIDTFNDFFKYLPLLKKSIEPQAKRSGISSAAALYLLTLNNSSFQYNDEEILQELKNKGLIEIEDNIIKITSKGSILAKSFNNTLEKLF